MAGAETTQHRNKYGVYSLPDGVDHRPAARAILAGLPYEPLTLDFMRAHAAAGDIIHAGTFFGDFIPALSTALVPDARLWAFEPNPASFAAAQQTIALNGLQNVNLTNAALSDEATELRFRTHTPKGKPLGGTSHIVAKDGSGVQTVQCVKLDEAVPPSRTISILQLDVEGHEKPALLGARRIVTDHQPIIILENFQDADWLNATFAGLDYRQVGTLHGNQVYAVPGRAVAF